MQSFEYQALFDKSKVYISRALKFDKDGEDESFQLWAALSLELLGKAALSKIHPVLVADPNDVGSVFAACGKSFSTQHRSITAKTLFDRLKRVSKKFQDLDCDFCMQLIYRRNEELHSGSLPYCNIRREHWLPRFWTIAETVLEAQDKSLTDWISDEQHFQAMIDIAQADFIEKINKLIIKHNEIFNKKFPSEAEKTSARTKAKEANYFEQKLIAIPDFVDKTIEEVCPACKCNAVLGVTEWSADPTGEYEEDWMEVVEVTYTSAVFYCPTCALEILGSGELSAAGLPSEIEVEELREMEFQPDYGND